VREWFAVKAKARLERQATVTLQQRGIETYLPLLPVRRRTQRAPSGNEPLFPGYFFSRLDLGTPEWIVARSAPGVAYFVGTPGAPVAVPDALIEEIRRRSDRANLGGWKSPFERGDGVRIERGPFQGLDAIFESSLSAKGRVRILLELVGRLVAVDLDVGMLQSGVNERPWSHPVA
jgi:transcriptional antiterminator RfaH